MFFGYLYRSAAVGHCTRLNKWSRININAKMLCRVKSLMHPNLATVKWIKNRSSYFLATEDMYGGTDGVNN